jgi:hypothetical protein
MRIQVTWTVKSTAAFGSGMLVLPELGFSQWWPSRVKILLPARRVVSAPEEQ